ncbi:DUF4175 family protein [Draconibacterium halophilum]|uniref:DUF4175 domain-containing protein n=1 Tax=Draconibacterium halophilum TaxID=2706887 RepID=A0A6C0R9B3_9BACT|nr:DUF4175 family protein [Draconibacterium halophilum]QIA06532.1 hypothetical protein G0Q07_01760 [Draconibacterium halophilum]
MTENFNILVNKLNAFRFKYGLYKLVRGAALVFILLITLYTVFSVVEYYVYLSSLTRKVIFYGFIIFAGLISTQFIFIPLFRLLHILKPIDLKSSTNLIQKHFGEIKDKLLNIIELSDLHEKQYSNELLIASIDQKIDELKVFNFNEAIEYKNIKIVSIYLLISILIASGILLSNKNIFTESTNRLVHFNQEFVKPAPFSFHIKNETLKAKKGDSYTVIVEAEGDEIPQIVYINIEGNNYLMKTKETGNYEFEMASVINPVSFYFTDLNYKSDSYTLQLLPKPGINSFTVNVDPPRYTLTESQRLENIGDLQVPCGTILKWQFTGIDVDSLALVFNDSVRVNATQNEATFKVEKKVYESTDYNVYIRNKVTEEELALSYNIDVIPDIYPDIEVMRIEDSTRLTRFFFKGVIGDDYGFSALQFHYNIANEDTAIALPFSKNVADQEFYFSYDFNDIESDGAVSYYFSVSDNDVINGYKTTTSDSYTFVFPDKEELEANEKEQFENLEKMIAESQELSKEIQNNLQNLQIKNMDTNTSDWEKSQMVNDIVQKQNQLEKLYDKIKEDNKKLNNYLNSFSDNSQEIIEKQKQIEELLKEVFTDELQELMDEFNKLAEEFDSKKLNELTRDMNVTMDDLQKQLDRNLEMLKKFKVEQKLQELADEMSEMAMEEENMAQEVSEEKNYEETSEKVSEHQENIKDIEKRLKEALEMNKELEEPIGFDDFDEEFDELEKSTEDSKENLEKKNRKKSSQSIQKTSEQMKNAAFAMQQMLDMNSMQQNQENIQNLRQILSNLVLLSFNQEDVLRGLSGISAKDPRLTELNREQKRIEDQSKIVRDSLYTLAMRTPQISSMINNELVDMEINLAKSGEQLEEALFPQARSSQQFVITATNNLALLLNESLEQLEKQQANAQPGDQQCENPGQGSSGMGDLKESSESIKQQLQKMIEQMKNGNSQGLSKQMGQSLMQHEMMQQMLRDLMNNGNVGSQAQETFKQIDQMLEENRRELMNKSINAETIARQNLITTRLLEAEKAENEREFEDKRESESAEDFYSNPVTFFEYKEKENFSIEYLNRNSNTLNNFYNKKYKNYLNKIERQSEE